MNDAELGRLIVNNIKREYRKKSLFDIIIRIKEYELTLGSTQVFEWSNSPEGWGFWFDVYEKRCNSTSELLELIYSGIENDNTFINLSLYV